MWALILPPLALAIVAVAVLARGSRRAGSWVIMGLPLAPVAVVLVPRWVR